MTGKGGTGSGKARAEPQREQGAARGQITGRSPGSVIGMLKRDHHIRMDRIHGRVVNNPQGSQPREGVLDDEIPLGGSASTMGSAVSSYNSTRHAERADRVLQTLIDKGIVSNVGHEALSSIKDELVGQFATEKRLRLEYKANPLPAGDNGLNAPPVNPTAEEKGKERATPSISARAANLRLIRPGETIEDAQERLAAYDSAGKETRGPSDSMMGLGLDTSGESEPQRKDTPRPPRKEVAYRRDWPQHFPVPSKPMAFGSVSNGGPTTPPVTGGAARLQETGQATTSGTQGLASDPRGPQQESSPQGPRPQGSPLRVDWKTEPVSAQIPPRGGEHGESTPVLGTQGSGSEMSLTAIRGGGVIPPEDHDVDPAIEERLRLQLIHMSEVMEGKEPTVPDQNVRFDENGEFYLVDDRTGGAGPTATSSRPVGAGWGGAGAPPNSARQSSASRRVTCMDASAPLNSRQLTMHQVH